MRSSLVLFLALTLSACGILGKKEDLKRVIEYKTSSDGCLNEFGPNMQKFLDGSIADDTWAKTWDCTVDSLDVFTQFVTGSVQDGYTQKDVQDFVSTFLVSNKSVSGRLIDASFALKASILGGSREVVTKREFQKFIQLMKVGKQASLQLLPYLRVRHDKPSGENLILLSDAILDFGNRVADTIQTGGNSPFMLSDAEALIDELSKLHGWNISKDWVPPGMAAKVLLLGGADNQFEGSSWPAIFRTVSTFGGPLVVMATASNDDVRARMTGPNEYGNLLIHLAQRSKATFDHAVEINDGVILYSKFEKLIDLIPMDPNHDSHYWQNWDRQKIKDNLLRLLIHDFLWSQNPLGMDRNVLDTIFMRAEQWRLAQTHLETLFQRYNLPRDGVTRDTFRRRALDYAKELKAAGDDVGYHTVTDRLIHLVDDYEPLFKGDAWQIAFTGDLQYSLGNVSKMIWINLAVQHLLNSPSLVKIPGLAQESDFTDLIKKFDPLAEMMQLYDPSIQGLGKKRFADANMFMLSSNGDKYVDEKEATYYIATIVSAGTLQERIRKHMTTEDPTGHDCRVRDAQGSTHKDVLGYDWMSPMCFRNEYFGNREKFWDYFPKLLRHYDSLSECDRFKLAQSIELTARRYGIRDDMPIGGLDTSSYAAFIHYIEFLFMRYDHDDNQKLTVDEVEAAFPNFKGTLTLIRPDISPDDDRMWESIFTYVVKFGRKPDTTGQQLELIWWKSWRPFWKIDASRKSIFDVIPVIQGPPDTAPPADPIPGDVPPQAPQGCS